MPFMPARSNFDWMINLNAAARKNWIQMAEQAREATLKLLRAGVTVGTGTDIWQIPTGVHMELEQLVAAGLTPLEAIHAGTGGAATAPAATAQASTCGIPMATSSSFRRKAGLLKFEWLIVP